MIQYYHSNSNILIVVGNFYLKFFISKFFLYIQIYSWICVISKLYCRISKFFSIYPNIFLDLRHIQIIFQDIQIYSCLYPNIIISDGPNIYQNICQAQYLMIWFAFLQVFILSRLNKFSFLPAKWIILKILMKWFLMWGNLLQFVRLPVLNVHFILFFEFAGFWRTAFLIYFIFN